MAAFKVFDGGQLESVPEISTAAGEMIGMVADYICFADMSTGTVIVPYDGDEEPLGLAFVELRDYMLANFRPKDMYEFWNVAMRVKESFVAYFDDDDACAEFSRRIEGRYWTAFATSNVRYVFEDMGARLKAAARR
jgi:hypothetical protein